MLFRRIQLAVTAWRRHRSCCQGPCSGPDVPAHDQKVSKSEEFAPLGIRDVMLLTIPSVAYFATVLLAGLGMLFIPASICFMVQASCIIFTALCSVTILRRKLNGLHLRGIAAAVVGVFVVSYAGLLHAGKQAPPIHIEAAEGGGARAGGALPEHATRLILGVSLTLASQFTQALQLVSEEALLSNSRLHPQQVVGVEGVLSTLCCGAALAVASLLPGADAGSAESWQDTLAQIDGSKPLLLMCIFQVLGMGGTNFFGIRVSVRLGSVFRTVLLSLRTLLIWSANLAVYYANGGGDIGEGWDHVASPIQCAGFALLLSGTLLYARGNATSPEPAQLRVKADSAGTWQAVPGCSALDGKWGDADGALEAGVHGGAAWQPLRSPPAGHCASPEGQVAAASLEGLPLLGGRRTLEAEVAAAAAEDSSWLPFWRAAAARSWSKRDSFVRPLDRSEE